MTDALGHSVTFGYDAAGQQTTLTDANGSVWKTAYDAAGSVATTTDPLGHTATYTHDTAGLLTSSLDARGITTTYGYNTAGALASIATPSGTISTTYDSAGRRATMTDPTGTTTYGYDTAGRLSSIAGPATGVAYTYDPAGNRATMTAAGKVTTYGYDGANRLSTVSRPDIGAFGLTYNPDGQLSTITRPNGVTSTNTYDTAGRLSGLTYKNTGGTTIAAYTYGLDAAGNRTSASTNGATDHYNIDPAGRLTGLTYADGTAVTFGYDAAGNRKSMTAAGSTTAYSYDAAEQLTSAGSTTYTYDAAGNRLTAGTSAFTYDGFGNLASATAGATTIAYRTNGSGLRVSANDGSTTTTYAWDAAAALPALLSDGTNGYLSADSTLLAETSASANAYPLTDALGSVRGQSDGTGAVTASASYGVYGDVRSSSGSVGSLGYTGALSDASGLVYLNARSLDPSTGTFTSRDPMTPGGPGVTGFNPYAYAGQNPTTYTDPSGREGIAEGRVMNLVATVVMPALSAVGSLVVSEILGTVLVLLVAVELARTATQTLPWTGNGPRAGTGSAPISWDLPWDKIGRLLRDIPTEIARTITAACAATSISTRIAGAFGIDVNSLCSGRVNAFLSGGDVREASQHDLDALAGPNLLRWARLTFTARNLPDQWYYLPGNTPNACSVGLSSASAAPNGPLHCDEFPYGTTAEGGPGADLRLINGHDNSTQGTYLRWFRNKCGIPFDEGEKSKFFVLPIPDSPATLYMC